MATACAVVSLTVASFAARVMLCATSAPLMAMSSAAARMLPDTVHELTAMDWPGGKDVVRCGRLREQLALAEPDDVVSQHAACVVGDFVGRPGVVVVCVMRFVRREWPTSLGRWRACPQLRWLPRRMRAAPGAFAPVFRGVASPCGNARACKHDERERCKKRYSGHDVLLRLRLRDATAVPASRESAFARRLSPFRQYTCSRACA